MVPTTAAAAAVTPSQPDRWLHCGRGPRSRGSRPQPPRFRTAGSAPGGNSRAYSSREDEARPRQSLGTSECFRKESNVLPRDCTGCPRDSRSFPETVERVPDRRVIPRLGLAGVCWYRLGSAEFRNNRAIPEWPSVL